MVGLTKLEETIIIMLISSISTKTCLFLGMIVTKVIFTPLMPPVMSIIIVYYYTDSSGFLNKYVN